MKYVITGAAGHISRPLAERLLAAGQDVTVIGRNAAHLQPLTDKGARAAIGEIEDTSFLTEVFTGADAVYTMIPPQYTTQSLDAYQQQGARYAQALTAANVAYAVNLSSQGAHLPEGCGPVSGLYRVEQELNRLPSTQVLHLRPGFFYINFYGNLDMIKKGNILGGNYGDSGNLMILSHPQDIAEAAAEALLQLSFTRPSVRYLASDERTMGDIAKVLGTAVGKPDLPWVAFNDEQAHDGLTQAGLPGAMVDKYVEMGSAIRTGIMWEDYLQHRPQQLGRTKLEDFAQEFAKAYRAADG